MTILTEQEAISLLHSHGIKCSKNDVTHWLSEGKIKAFQANGTYRIKEDEVYNFLHLYRWEGTAYEPGIDDKTKINRLLEEIEDLKQEILKLQNENTKLEEQSENLPF